MTQNILLIAPQPFYQDRGTPIAIKELCYALESLDVEITLLCLLEGEDIPLPRNVILKRATYPKFLFNLKPGFSWKKVLVDLYLIKEASKLIQQNNYDLLVAVEEAAIFSAIFFGNRIPLLVDMDSDITEQMTNANGFWKPFKPVLDVIYSIPFSKCISVKAVCKELCYTAIRLGAKQCYLLEDCAETFREPNFIDPDLKRM
ncbi:MAG: hypothetical protein NZO16_01595, partial [Deltaproteobacteria bacterium]|nr:hypothetical protein [Deltaproteobacteria bacterium]